MRKVQNAKLHLGILSVVCGMLLASTMVFAAPQAGGDATAGRAAAAERNMHAKIFGEYGILIFFHRS